MLACLYKEKNTAFCQPFHLKIVKAHTMVFCTFKNNQKCLPFIYTKIGMTKGYYRVIWYFFFIYDFQNSFVWNT